MKTLKEGLLLLLVVGIMGFKLYHIGPTVAKWAAIPGLVDAAEKQCLKDKKCVKICKVRAHSGVQMCRVEVKK